MLGLRNFVYALSVLGWFHVMDICIRPVVMPLLLGGSLLLAHSYRNVVVEKKI